MGHCTNLYADHEEHRTLAQRTYYLSSQVSPLAATTDHPEQDQREPGPQQRTDRLRSRSEVGPDLPEDDWLGCLHGYRLVDLSDF